jgi:hypothetical protein
VPSPGIGELDTIGNTVSKLNEPSVAAFPQVVEVAVTLQIT